MQIPAVAMFNEDCLMLVIEDSHCGRRVPIQMCTLHIDHIPVLMILEELARLNKEWIQGRISRILAAKVAHVETVEQKQGGST